jgi:hypothetical protein
MIKFFENLCCIKRNKYYNVKKERCACVKIITKEGNDILYRNSCCSSCKFNNKNADNSKWILL